MKGVRAFARLVAGVATLAVLIAGFVLVFGNVSATGQLRWIEVGLIAAGVALAAIIGFFTE